VEQKLYQGQVVQVKKHGANNTRVIFSDGHDDWRRISISLLTVPHPNPAVLSPVTPRSTSSQRSLLPQSTEWGGKDGRSAHTTTQDARH
jgi:hypothetical protein